jgi:hypothetical protein
VDRNVKERSANQGRDRERRSAEMMMVSEKKEQVKGKGN